MRTPIDVLGEAENPPWFQLLAQTAPRPRGRASP